MTLNRTLLITIIGILVCAGAFVLRIALAANDSILEHDDAISLLVATGHMGDMADIVNQRIPPYFEDVPATQWQRLIQPEQSLNFQKIAYDVSQIDRHPPMYFWVLDLWVSLFSASAFSVVMLNVVIDLLTAIVLYRFCRHFFEQQYALLVVIVWLLMPISIHVSTSIRPYAFLALSSLLFADATYRIFFSPEHFIFSLKNSIEFLIVTILMISIHYYMIYIVGAAILTVFARSFRTDYKCLIIMILYLLLSGILLLIIHPDYIAPFLRKGQTFFVDMPFALEHTLIFTFSFIVDAPFQRGRFVWMRPLLVILMIAVPIVILIVRRVQPVKAEENQVNRWDLFYVFIFFILAYLGIVGMYLAGMTPLNYRYFAHPAVFAAILPVFFLHMIPLKKLQFVLILAIACFMIISGILTTRELIAHYWRIATPDHLPNGSELVIVNMGKDHDDPRQVTTLGHLLQVVYNLQATNHVIAAYIDSFLKQPDLWLPELCNYDTILLLGFSDADLFQLLEDQGFILKKFPSYMYYTDTRQVTVTCESVSK